MMENRDTRSMSYDTKINTCNRGSNVNVKQNSHFLALFVMAVCSFCIGMTEFLPAGLLINISNSFKVSISKAGTAVSGYAMAVAISAPMITAMTIRLKKKYLLSGLMAFFILGNMLTACSKSFDFLLLGRFISALCHGAFFGIGAIVASSLVTPDKKASAIAMMFTGLTLANITGVPLGTLLGQHYGWRLPFWAISYLGIVGLIGIALFIPKKINIPETDLRKEIRTFRNVGVWLALGITALGFSGLITSYTYITPLLIHISNFSEGSIVWLLGIYGLGLVLGNIFGGKAADYALRPTIYILLTLLIVLLLSLLFISYYRVPMVIFLFFLGFIGFATVAPFQLQIMNRAKQSPTLASSANISAFNLGISIGVYLGGLAISSGYGYASPNWVGAILVAIALALTWLSGTSFFTKKQTE